MVSAEIELRYSSCTSTDDDEPDDTASEDFDEARHDLFIEEYFRQQYLIMQDIYSSCSKSKWDKCQYLSDFQPLNLTDSSSAGTREQTAITTTTYSDEPQQQKQNQNEISSETFSINCGKKEVVEEEKKKKTKKASNLWKKLESLGRALVSGKTKYLVNLNHQIKVIINS